MTPAQVNVFVRYGLMMLGGVLIRGGWLPEAIALEMARDPIVIEAVAGLVVTVTGVAWYFASKSRKALKDAMQR